MTTTQLHQSRFEAMFTKLRDVFSSLKSKKEKKLKPIPKSNSIPFEIALATNNDKVSTAVAANEKDTGSKEETKDLVSKGGAGGTKKSVYGPYEVNKTTATSSFSPFTKRSKVPITERLSKPEFTLLASLHEAYHHPTVLDVHRDLIWGLLKEKKAAKKAAANLNRVRGSMKAKIERAKMEVKEENKDVVLEATEAVVEEMAKEKVGDGVVEGRVGEVVVEVEKGGEDRVEEKAKKEPDVVEKEEAIREEVENAEAKSGVEQEVKEQVEERVNSEKRNKTKVTVEDVTEDEVNPKMDTSAANEEVKKIPVPSVSAFVFPPLPLLICYDVEKVQEKKSASDNAENASQEIELSTLPANDVVRYESTTQTPTVSESGSEFTIKSLASYEPALQASASAVFDAEFAELSRIQVNNVGYQVDEIATSADADDGLEWDDDYEFPVVDYMFEVDDEEEESEHEDRVLKVYGADWKWVKKVDVAEQKEVEAKEGEEEHGDSVGQLAGDGENWVENRMSWWKEKLSADENDGEGVFNRSMGLALEKMGDVEDEEEVGFVQDDATSDQLNQDHLVTEHPPHISTSSITQTIASPAVVPQTPVSDTPRPTYPRTLDTSQLEVVRLLGKGANSKVYVVKDVASRRHLALKVVSRYGQYNSGRYTYEDVISMLFGEQTLLKKHSRLRDARNREIERRRISRAFESWTPKKGRNEEMEGDEVKSVEDVDWTIWLEASWSDANNYYLAMPLLPTSIDEIIMEVGRIIPDITRFYTVELIIALEFLHSKGVIHRDIKTANLFLSKTGHVLLGDFGFAKDFHKIPSLPERVFQPYWPYLPSQTIVDSSTPRADPEDLTFVSNVPLGSPYEASPEIYLNDYYSFGVDFWAAGVCMFEMLTGHPPWYDDDPEELRRQVIEDEPVYYDDDPIDEVTRDFIESMLAKEPEDRLRIGSDMRSHGYFAGINWEEYETQSVPAPWIPPRDTWKHKQCYDAHWDPQGEDALVPGQAFGEDEDPDDGEFDYNSEWVKRAGVDEEAAREEQQVAEEDNGELEDEGMSEEEAMENAGEEETGEEVAEDSGEEKENEAEVVMEVEERDQFEANNEDLDQADTNEDKQVGVPAAFPTLPTAPTSPTSQFDVQHAFFKASISNINLLKLGTSLRSIASTRESISVKQENANDGDHDDKENDPFSKSINTLSSKQGLLCIQRSFSSSSILLSLVSQDSHSSLQSLHELPENERIDEVRCDSAPPAGDETSVEVSEQLSDATYDSDDTFETAHSTPTPPFIDVLQLESYQPEDTTEDAVASTQLEVHALGLDETEVIAKFDATPYPSSQLLPSESGFNTNGAVSAENEGITTDKDDIEVDAANANDQQGVTTMTALVNPEATFNEVLSQFASEQHLDLDAPLPSPWSPLPSPWSPSKQDNLLENQFEDSILEETSQDDGGSTKGPEMAGLEGEGAASTMSIVQGYPTKERTTTIQILQTPLRHRTDSNLGHQRAMSEKVGRAILGNATNNVDSRPGSPNATPTGKSSPLGRKFSLKRAMTVPKSLKVGSPGKEKEKASGKSSSPTRSNTLGRFGGHGKGDIESENNGGKMERSPSSGSGGVMDKLKGWKKKVMNKVGSKEA